MTVYRLQEVGEISPAAITPLFYGRYLAPVRDDGTVVCDGHQFTIDSAEPPHPGEKVMIWCSYDYYCCTAEEYETSHAARG